MTQKDSICSSAFAVSYQEKVLENDSKNSDKNLNTTTNAAAVISNLKDKKICFCEQKHQF